MKYFFMNLLVMYVIFCADDVDDKNDHHSLVERIFRTILWPLTLTEWFRTSNQRLHRLLTILWTILIAGWLLSLVADKL